MRRAGNALDLILRIGRAMLGAPDYEAYLARHRQLHPERPPLDRAAFFHSRQQARYDGSKGNSRCC